MRYVTRLEPQRLRLLASLVSLMGIGMLGACGPGHTEFAVGSCIAKEANQDGAAIQASCADPTSITITKLTRNGGIPDCPYYMPDGPQLVQDVTSQVTYCGYLNRPKT